MKILETIDHIAFEVQNIEEAVKWYTSQFSCEIVYHDETWAMLRFNNINLAFVLPDQHPAHIAINKIDAEKFGPLKTHRDGVKFIYIEDNQGNTVEIIKR
jgi:catechol 2,3-dioxygenase-like lactoylglutathione lyase family enzyme